MEQQKDIMEEAEGELFEKFKTLGFGPEDLINLYQWSQAFPLLKDEYRGNPNLRILNLDSEKQSLFHRKGQPQTIRQCVHKILLCPGIKDQIHKIKKEEEMRELRMTKGDIFLSVYLQGMGISEPTIELLRINGVTSYQILKNCRQHLKEIGIEQKEQKILMQL